MTGEIQSRDAMLALIAGGATPTQALSAFLRAEDEKRRPARIKNTVATRKAALKKAVAELDMERLGVLGRRMASYIDKVCTPDIVEPRMLTELEAFSLMEEYIDQREIAEFLTTRRETMKELVFGAIDAENTAKGFDPEITNGEIPVPGLGKVFRKEGAGRSEPDFDEKKLRKLLGDRADRVYREEIIPEQRTEVLDEEALLRLAQEDPSVMEVIRESLIPGKPKNPRFVVRDLSEEEA